MNENDRLGEPNVATTPADATEEASPASGRGEEAPSTAQRRSTMTVTLIAPTLNEVDAIRIVFPQIRRDWVDEIIVVDGGSTDGTVEYCEEIGFRVVKQTGKGYGNALREAIAASTGDYIIEFQPDGNSLPEMVLPMIEKIDEGYDLVIGSRYVGDATSYDDDRLTKVGNRIFTWMVNVLFRASYTDVLIGFRIFRRDAFEALQIDTEGLSWAIQLPIRFAKKGFRITEIAADEPARLGGKRKMRPFKHGFEFLLVMLREFVTR